ncbi:nitrate respiration regulation accessory nitrate sensor NreA [Staphylococcus schleiferi]|nr:MULTISPECIES: nitrate respiration regulation accessory nitrate sensor NreA [Staphylococcus]UXR55398.1 nitrate respiration regulation accessory nitrate sensor NreA [Staphylococcus schleiferi]UXR57706.1 nitrate respiration regulation accessory nitrate sensor NreA [Staphylococcus schleiferi]UXR59993.1 nitrate respiration regulation accessory nitrate sensor NreA [Staphylococcus schleiferi]UXR62307.1 nitrate respiration regulation accessory nitrate sensor NreA [Staphylococcus schleiferi]
MTVNQIDFSQHDYQDEIDRIRHEYEFDFAGIALPSEDHVGTKIKWRYVSGNLNERYQRIVLRHGHGVAGNVMKTGKPMVIPDTTHHEIQSSLFNFPILMSEQITALIAIPLWHNHRVKGVLLLGQRNQKPLPQIARDLSLIKGIGGLTSEDKVML